MSSVVDISIPPAEFELGTLDGAIVTFERCVDGQGGPETFVWVETDDHSAFVRAVEQRPAVDSITREHREADGRTLYLITWDRPTGGLLECLEDVSAVVLRASGTSRGWRFRLRFPDHDTLMAFQRRCTERDVTLSVDRLMTDAAGGEGTSALTDLQRETLAVAVERGYYDVPRRITMVELAAELGVSDQAISARLRRATKALANESVTGTGEQTPLHTFEPGAPDGGIRH